MRLAHARDQRGILGRKYSALEGSCDAARLWSVAAGAPDAKDRRMTHSPFRWHRTVAIGYAIVFVIIMVWTWLIIFTDQKASDFLSYWAADPRSLRRRPSLTTLPCTGRWS